jgi:hypothetical protein
VEAEPLRVVLLVSNVEYLAQADLEVSIFLQWALSYVDGPIADPSRTRAPEATRSRWKRSYRR